MTATSESYYEMASKQLGPKALNLAKKRSTKYLKSPYISQRQLRSMNQETSQTDASSSADDDSDVDSVSGLSTSSGTEPIYALAPEVITAEADRTAENRAAIEREKVRQRELGEDCQSKTDGARACARRESTRDRPTGPGAAEFSETIAAILG